MIAAMFWVGGMLFFSIILVPCLRQGLSERERAGLISRVGKRFRVSGWISLAVLLLSGLFRLIQGGLPVNGYGNTLKMKLILVFLMVVLTVLHDFIFGPKSRIHALSDEQKNTYLKVGRWIARVNLLIGLLIVFSAVSLVRGF
ncbi:MAG: DUF4149 domain-containing protein [Nitrospiria bacterium]